MWRIAARTSPSVRSALSPRGGMPGFVKTPDAHTLATQFRSRPDLAKSEKKGEGSDLVRAYLLIDAALTS